MFKITPKHKDKIVKDPETMKSLTDAGVIVRKLDTYWTNRFNDGDINVKDLSKEKKPKQISETKKEEGKS